MTDTGIRVEVEPRGVQDGELVEYGFINFVDYGKPEDPRLITRLTFSREDGVQDWYRDSANKSKTNRKEIQSPYLDLAYKALAEAGLHHIPRFIIPR